jgi:hypothetical protein
MAQGIDRNRPAKSLSSLRHLCLTSRDFVPWRFLDAGLLSVRSPLVAGGCKQIASYSITSSARARVLPDRK